MLAAYRDSVDQRTWQAGAAHALLDRGNIIRHAPKFDDVMIHVGHRKRGARISIARLANRTWIEQVPRSRFQTQSRKTWSGLRLELNDSDLPRAIRKTALVMRVAEKSYVTGGFEQATHRL